MTQLANMIITKMNLTNDRKDHLVNHKHKVHVEGVDLKFKLDEEQYDNIIYRTETCSKASLIQDLKPILKSNEGTKWIKNCLTGEVTPEDLDL